jgi:SAM-dependent methyltransferase
MNWMPPWLRETAEADGGLIDVNELIATLTDAELVASADAYFRSLDIRSEQCRKPFSNPKDAAHLTRNLGLLFEAAELFTGCDVLDFGCATGWLTHGLAAMGSHAVGVDIAPAALRLAEELAPLADPGQGSVKFLAYAGDRLPFDDESFDRIICFDSFHHVKDQAATLREFARVLRAGGRIAMLEPGPFHSRTTQSQDEMRRYRVIENDIELGRVARDAQAAGLDAPEMLVQLPKPLRLNLDEYLQWAAGGMTKTRAVAIGERMASQMVNTQCFYLTKGEPRIDSRQAGSLGAEIRLTDPISIQRAGFASFKVEVRNTGTGHWICDRPAKPGCVNLGVQLLGDDDQPVRLDFMRVGLPHEVVYPGSSLVLSVDIPLSVVVRRVRLDMVSEHVAWFAQLGRCHPVDINLCNLPDGQ